jgi:hypothetical protein
MLDNEIEEMANVVADAEAKVNVDVGVIIARVGLMVSWPRETCNANAVAGEGRQWPCHGCDPSMCSGQLVTFKVA